MKIKKVPIFYIDDSLYFIDFIYRIGGVSQHITLSIRGAFDSEESKLHVFREFANKISYKGYVKPSIIAENINTVTYILNCDKELDYLIGNLDSAYLYNDKIFVGDKIESIYGKEISDKQLFEEIRMLRILGDDDDIVLFVNSMMSDWDIIDYKSVNSYAIKYIGKNK